VFLKLDRRWSQKVGLPLFPKIGVYDLGEVPSPTSSEPHYLGVHELRGSQFGLVNVLTFVLTLTQC